MKNIWFWSAIIIGGLLKHLNILSPEILYVIIICVFVYELSSVLEKKLNSIDEKVDWLRDNILKS